MTKRADRAPLADSYEGFPVYARLYRSLAAGIGRRALSNPSAKQGFSASVQLGIAATKIDAISMAGCAHEHVRWVKRR